MKITRRQLRRLIKEQISDEDTADIETSAGLSPRTMPLTPGGADTFTPKDKASQVAATRFAKAAKKSSVTSAALIRDIKEAWTKWINGMENAGLELGSTGDAVIEIEEIFPNIFRKYESSIGKRPTKEAVDAATVRYMILDGWHRAESSLGDAYRWARAEGMKDDWNYSGDTVAFDVVSSIDDAAAVITGHTRAGSDVMDAIDRFVKGLGAQG